MERLKSLDPPHKGLRNALGKLALSAGKTDYTSLSSVTLLKEIANEVFHLLKDHTATENKFILAPLEQRNPGFTENYYQDHNTIDQLEQNLLDRFLSLNGKQTNDEGNQLYLDFCNFQSHYLEHINEEDSILELEMQKHFTDEELMQHQIEIMQEMSFDTLLLWFKYIAPARRPDENAQVLTGFKSIAPESVYNTVLTRILQLKSITRKKCCKYKRLLDFLTLPYFNILSTKKSAQTLVFIAFFPFITIPTAKSGFKYNKRRS